jgi:hypothetical protein
MSVVTTVANCMHKETKQKGLIFYFETISTNEQKLKLRKRSQEVEEIKQSFDINVERFSYSYRSVTLLYMCVWL